MSNREQRRAAFEAAVIARFKESGFLEVEIRVECLARSGDGYYDSSVDAYWHFWNAALDGVVLELPKIDVSLSSGHTDSWCEGVLYASRRYREALAAAGYEVAP